MAGLGPFRVGDQPADMLDLVIGRAGDDAPLSGFTAATVVLRKPDLTEVTWAGALIQPNIIRSAWPAGPFTQTGQHKIRTVLTGAGSISERGSWVRFWVR